MKTLEQFKNENQSWLESVISDYVSEMEWQEGMNSHPSDYFTDTLYISREKCQDEELALEVKEYIESEVISRLK
jgi:hypothetical protein